MKKAIAMFVAGLSMLAAPAAHAEAVKINGEVTVKYERDTAQGDAAVSGTMSTIKLNAETEIGSGLSLYARFAAQRATQPALADFNTGAYAANTKSVAALDQFGLLYKAGGFNYKLGRQGVEIGTEALLYKRNDEKIGKHAMVDGLSLSGTAGAMDLEAYALREDNEAGNPRGKIYAVRAGYSPLEKLNWGLTLGRYQKEGTDTTNHWALDGTYEFGKNIVTAQYAKSNAPADNKGYVMNWTYDFDGTTAVSLIAFRMEAAAAMGGQSEFDGGNKGFYYGLSHKLSKAASLELVYKDQKQISDGKKNAKFEAVVDCTF
jgi:hypothetical protein